MGPFLKTLGKIAAVWLLLPFLIFLYWVCLKLIVPGFGGWHTELWLWLDRWFYSGGGWLWIWLVIVSIISLLIVADALGYESRSSRQLHAGLGLLLVISLLVSGFQFINVIWNNDKDWAKYYASTTTFVIPDLNNPPASIRKLFDRNPHGDNKPCVLLGPVSVSGEADDIPVCITPGTLPIAGWESRVSSLDAAKFMLKNASGATPGTNINEDTVTYLNASNGNAARWSAIRDGSGISQPMDAIIEWTGQGSPTACFFRGPHSINRAFAGGKMNNLPNLLNDLHPRLLFDTKDAWGYCNNGEPVIVLPVQEQIHIPTRTAQTAAGVVIMRGSPSGAPKFEHKRNIAPGELPGPVYPMTLVAAQREAIPWTPGRAIMNNNNFGYDPTTHEAQEGNVSEYLLRSETDDRLYWVTPLTPNGDSQVLVGYSVTPADTVNQGSLNEQKIYMLADNDPRIINLAILFSKAQNYMAHLNPGFASNHGKVTEFLPTGGAQGDEWQAYGELNGQVIYKITLSASESVHPIAVSLHRDFPLPSPEQQLAGTTQSAPSSQPAQQGQAPTTQTPTGLNCGRPLDQIPPTDLITCIRGFADELARRPATNQPGG